MLTSWSHPLSILLIPIGIALFFMRPSLPDRIGNLGIVISTAAYARLGVQSTAHATLNGHTWVVTFQYFMHRVIFEAIFGDHVRSILEQTTYPWLINVLAAGILALLALAVWPCHERHSAGNDWGMLGFLTFVMFAITFLSAAGRSIKLEGIGESWGHRYFYLQQLIFAFLVILYIVRTVEWETMASTTKALMLVLASLYLISLNVCNERFFITSREHGIATLQFLRKAEQQLEHSAEPLIFPRGGEWDIVLAPRPSDATTP